MANDTDWIVYYGITTGYALGPYCDGAGSPSLPLRRRLSRVSPSPG